jgi:hypothetical protein
MLFNAEDITRIKDMLAEQHEKAAKALRELELAPFLLIETDHNYFIGEVCGIKGDNLLIKLLAAREVDHKVRNLRSKSIKRRTYPLPLCRINSTKVLKEDQVPLYINYKYLSPQFKNRYLR